MMNLRATILLLLVCIGLSPPANAEEPLDLIPADSLACWNGRPHPDTTTMQPEGGANWQSLLDLGLQLSGAPIDANTRIVLRSAEMFSIWIRYPHALALIDAKAKAADTDPNARRVDQLRFVLVAKTDRQSAPFLTIIQKSVNEQTDSGAATLEKKSAEGFTYFELRDQRLPAWCIIAWGEIREQFALTIGDGVWPQIAGVARDRSRSLAADPWYIKARQERGRDAVVEIFVAMKEIRARLDPLLQDRATAFFRAWEAENFDQAYWALGFKERALYCEAHFRDGERTVSRLLADPDVRDPALLAPIPPSARYAIYSLPMGDTFPRLLNSLIATRGPEDQRRILAAWSHAQKELGIDAQRDFLKHLGDHIVLHNEPVHPLRIPLAMTTLTEIRGDAATVRKTVDAVCGKLRDTINDAIADGKSFPLLFHRDDDGVWSLQIGPLAGPAWCVTDKFLVTSWSPAALREALRFAK